MSRFPETRRHELSQPLGGTKVAVGFLSGVLAGAAMLLFQSVAYWHLGGGFWVPERQVACALYGLDALIDPGYVVAAGIVIHFTTSVAWAIIFSAILPLGASTWTALWAGLAYSVGVWGVMTYGVLPWFNEYMYQRVAFMPEWNLYGHFVYGFGLLATPSLRRRLRGGNLSSRRNSRILPLTP
ncbi:MAG: hypothetical protein HY925_11070 [Elusimicrobia bacterium]|nr:hypothetical protein [Elusimicrobiota bacterium]